MLINSVVRPRNYEIDSFYKVMYLEEMLEVCFLKVKTNYYFTTNLTDMLLNIILTN